MAVLMLRVEDGVVTGCQTGPQAIEEEGYIVVDEATYNLYGNMRRTPNTRKEYMTYDGKNFIKHPDPRPEISIVVPQEKKVGEAVSVSVLRMSEGLESRMKKNDEVLVEYETPEGRIGLVKARLREGVATASFTPSVSGYYRFHECDRYKTAERAIAVYEE